MLGRFFGFLFIVLILTIGQSCSSYRDLQEPVIERISDVKWGGVSDGKVDFSLKTQIRNPGHLKFRIRKAELNLIYNNVRIGTLRSRNRVKINKALESEVEWKIRGDLGELLTKPAGILQGIIKGSSDLTLDGNITISKCIWRKTLPVSLSTPIKLPFK